jgi:hypothetical protein
MKKFVRLSLDSNYRLKRHFFVYLLMGRVFDDEAFDHTSLLRHALRLRMEFPEGTPLGHGLPPSFLHHRGALPM